MDKMTIDQLGPFFPGRLIEKTPDDAQIVIVGGYYTNTYHQQWFYLNLPDFAARGFQLAFAHRKDAHEGAQTMIDKMGFRPYHMQRYDHVEFLNHTALTSDDSRDPATRNPFKTYVNAAAQFKTAKAAQRLGMSFSFIDDPSVDFMQVQNNARMTQRARFMADEIATRAQDGRRILVFCGEDFLYSAPDLDGTDTSVQQLLRQCGFETYSVALINEPGDLLTDEEDVTVADYIEMADPEAGTFIEEFIRARISNPEDIVDEDGFDASPYFNELTEAFYLNISLATEKAGTVLPDQLVIFPQASGDDVYDMITRYGTKTNAVKEDEHWCESWRRNAIPAQRLYKAQRKNPAP